MRRDSLGDPSTCLVIEPDRAVIARRRQAARRIEVEAIDVAFVVLVSEEQCTVRLMKDADALAAQAGGEPRSVDGECERHDAVGKATDASQERAGAALEQVDRMAAFGSQLGPACHRRNRPVG